MRIVLIVPKKIVVLMAAILFMPKKKKPMAINAGQPNGLLYIPVDTLAWKLCTIFFAEPIYHDSSIKNL